MSPVQSKQRERKEIRRENGVKTNSSVFWEKRQNFLMDTQAADTRDQTHSSILVYGM
jgi:hypothetical protein